MNQGIKRAILRWIHIGCSMLIVGYVYSPFEEIPESMAPLYGLSSFLDLSLRDYGCGKAMSCDD